MSTSDGRIGHEPSSQRLIEDGEPENDAMSNTPSHPASSNDENIRTKDPLHATNENPEASPSAATRQTNIFKQWMLEWLSCLLAIAALIAIVVTLLLHDTRKLPDWPLRISVNALVSVFAVIMKLAMLFPVTEAISQLKWSWFQKPRPLTDFARFDDASRGLWGCATLIVRLRGVHLASAGAIVYLLATASDPFVQQLVRYVTCSSMVDSDHAHIARTNIYNESGIHLGPLDHSLDIPMQVAIYKCIYKAFTPISPQCSTGNCTFGEYRTLGMCSECSDVSAEVQYLKNATMISKPKSKNFTYERVFRLPSADNTEDVLEVSLPFESQMVVESGVDYSDPEAIVRTRFLQLDIDAPDFNTDSPKPQGYECMLAPCVRTYKAEVEKGKTRETLISEHRASAPRVNMFSQFGIAPMPCLLNGTYFNVTSFAKQNHSSWRPMVDALPQNQTAWVPDECWFAMNNGVHAMRQYLTSFLKGYGQYGVVTDLSSQSWIGLIFKEGTSVGNLSSIWSDLAESMTIQMRQAGTNATQPATGEVWRTGTCIQVQWAWLSYPIILLAGSIALLAATMVHSREQSPRQIWKSSALAILFHGLDSALKERVRDVDDTDEMERIARKLHAALYDEGRGVEIAERPGPYSTSSVAMSTLETLRLRKGGRAGT